MFKAMRDEELRTSLKYAMNGLNGIGDGLPAGAMTVYFIERARVKYMPKMAQFYASILDSTLYNIFVPKQKRAEPKEVRFAKYMIKKPKIVKETVTNMQKRGIGDPHGHGDPVSAFSKI